MTVDGLGATGQKIYDFIRDTQAATGLVPSVREIREAVGVSSIGTVGYWLDKLETLNLIRRDSGKNRSIQLRGESPTVSVPLVGDQIAEDDYVVVREQPTAEHGDIVAALVPSYDPEATIKRLSLGDGRVLLLPANPAYEPIEADDLQILGRVVTVLRRI